MKIEKETPSHYFSRGGTLTLEFGNKEWRIETKNNQGLSELSLFADGKCIFKGRYGDLVKVITSSSI